MTRKLLLPAVPAILLAALLLAACASTETGSALSLQEAIEQSAEQMARELPQKSRIAVVAFESPNDNLSGYIMDELNGELRKRGIEVVDRQRLGQVLKELNFQASDLVDQRTAASVGKFLGATIVISGQLRNMGAVYRYQASAIHVETAAFAGSARFDVRNDKKMQGMIRG